MTPYNCQGCQVLINILNKPKFPHIDKIRSDYVVVDPSFDGKEDFEIIIIGKNATWKVYRTIDKQI